MKSKRQIQQWLESLPDGTLVSIEDGHLVCDGFESPTIIYSLAVGETDAKVDSVPYTSAIRDFLDDNRVSHVAARHLLLNLICRWELEAEELGLSHEWDPDEVVDQLREIFDILPKSERGAGG